MKHLLATAFIACTLLASPVLAQTPGGEHHEHRGAGHHHARHEHREHHRDHHDHGHHDHHE